MGVAMMMMSGAIIALIVLSDGVGYATQYWNSRHLAPWHDGHV